MKAHDVTEFDEELVALVERMQLLMKDAQGVGLAATQLGMLRRVFVFEPDERARSAVVNPRLVDPSDEQGDRRGGLPVAARASACRSRAPSGSTIEGKDPSGKDVRHELEGLAARVVQHELDHLDGVLIIDRTDAEHRKEALGALRPQPILR